jgi:hypothetical protein
MSNNNSSLIPLNEYLLEVFSKPLLSKDFIFDKRFSKNYDGSLILINNKPMATFSYETSPWYMPFIIQISSAGKKRHWTKYPLGSIVEYGERGKERFIPVDADYINKIIEEYGFTLYYKNIDVNVVQSGTNKEFISKVLLLYPKTPFGKSTSEEDKRNVEAKVKSLIQALQSATPMIRDYFDVIYTIDTSSNQELYPYVVLIPKEFLSEISDFLLSQYQQIDRKVTPPPAEFIPNGNVNSPELQQFIDKLPLETVTNPLFDVGTYGSSPAVILPKGDYSRYLTGNERVIDLGDKVIVVFGNPQLQQVPTTQTPEQQNTVPATPQSTPQVQEQQNQSSIPLNEYLLEVFSKPLLSKDFIFDKRFSKNYDGSLILINNKPMATFSYETSPWYMPFIIQISSAGKKRHWTKYPLGSIVEYGERGKERFIPVDADYINKIIEEYGFTLYYKNIDVNVVQSGTNKEFISKVLLLYPKTPFGKSTSEEDKRNVEAKVKSLIQALQSATPMIRDYFDVIYTIDTSSNQELYPYVVLIPKEFLSEISDFLLSQYQQIDRKVTPPPAEFIPNGNVNSPELQQFIDKLPLETVTNPLFDVGTYGSSPAVILPKGDYSRYLTGNERVIDLGDKVIVVFGNPQLQQVPTTQTPEQQNTVPATPQSTPQVQEQQNVVQNQVENNNAEQKKAELEKVLNLELAPFIPDWLKPYLNKYGIKEGESLTRKEREEFAEKVWNELQKNWNKILELLDADNTSIFPTTALALVSHFPSEYKGSKKKVVRESESVKEETIRETLSNMFETLRIHYFTPVELTIAPDKVLDLRIMRPMTPDEFESYLKDLSGIVQLFRDAYVIFSFVNWFKNKSYFTTKGIQNLKNADPQKLKYLEDLDKAFTELWTLATRLSLPLIVDKNNTLLVGSVDELPPDNEYTILKLNDFDLNQASEEQLKKLKSLLNFAKKAFDDQYGVLIVKATVSPSTLDMQVFKTIVKLLGICEEGDEVCLYKARQELSAFPESLKEKFIDNFAKETGRNPKYRIEYTNLFATLFALVNYYNYLEELNKEAMKNHGIRKLEEKEEEKVNKILGMVKEGYKI